MSRSCRLRMTLGPLVPRYIDYGHKHNLGSLRTVTRRTQVICRLASGASYLARVERSQGGSTVEFGVRLGLLVLRMKVLYIFNDTRTWIRRPALGP